MDINLVLHYKNRKVTVRKLEWSDRFNAYLVYLLPGHPFKSRKYRFGAYKLTHIVYWLRTGKFVPKGHVIHHSDHNPENNVFENYELMTRAAHAAHHHTGKKRSAKTRAKLKATAAIWSSTPEFRKLVSERAKQQHRENNFGRHTWRTTV